MRPSAPNLDTDTKTQDESTSQFEAAQTMMIMAFHDIQFYSADSLCIAKLPNNTANRYIHVLTNIKLFLAERQGLVRNACN